MGRKLLFFLIYVSAAVLRLSVLFRQELIPGVNGGYYPLQVRSLLENGRLGFPDMPLYFWFNAFWVKVMALVTATPVAGWIIPIVKTVDALFLPLLLIPLYGITQLLRDPDERGWWREAAVAVFVVLSPWPFQFLGDLQKNAFAIPFFFAFLWYALRYLEQPSRRWLVAGLLSLTLIGVAHFGVFTVAVLTLGVGLAVYARRRALLPLAILASLALGLVALFDPSRAWRLLTVAGELFRHPAILQVGPPELLSFLLSWGLIGWSIYTLRRNKERLDDAQRVAIPTLSILVFILSFPLLNGDYAQRLMLMLFVPQAVLCLFLFRLIPRRWGNILAVGLLLISLLLTPGALRFKQPVISPAAFADLKTLKQELPLDERTLFIARHGLEWWTGWVFQTNTGNEKGVDAATPGQYRQVFYLHQKKGMDAPGPGPVSGPGPGNKRPGFREPQPPFGELYEVLDSEFFRVYSWKPE